MQFLGFSIAGIDPLKMWLPYFIALLIQIKPLTKTAAPVTMDVRGWYRFHQAAINDSFGIHVRRIRCNRLVEYLRESCQPVAAY